MICKRTYKNQITIPKKIMDHFGETEYFEVEEKDKTIILRPVVLQAADKSSLEKIRQGYPNIWG